MAAAEKFRLDINGLRAWAVGLVVLYHFGVPGFSGGFIGVDVFFVISGFLMTSIVIRGLEGNAFSVLDFYLSRARRIVPALAVLCLALLCLGYWALFPLDYKLLSTHAISTLGFFSNLKFWGEAGYFDAASHEKWLLHTWSLSVEWQFYLLLPLGMSLIWRLRPGRRCQAWAIAVGIAVSLGLSIALTPPDPSMAFYLLPTRAWEMLAGGVAYLVLSGRSLTPGAARWMERTAFALMALAVLGFDTSSPWPGWRALVPVVAAVMVLASGRSGSGFTSGRFAQWLGDRSYSLYLWHWPVYVALVFNELQRDPAALIAGLALTFVLGHLSYRWVEGPARHLFAMPATKQARVACVVIVILVAATPALAVRFLNGIGGRFPPDILAVAAERNNSNPRRDECHLLYGESSPSCVYGEGPVAAVAIGDSHTYAIVSSLGEAGRPSHQSVVEWSYSACLFVYGGSSSPRALAKFGANYKCAEFIRWAADQLRVQHPGAAVVLTNRYAPEIKGANEDAEAGSLLNALFEYDAGRDQLRAEAFQRAIVETACQIGRDRKVFLVRPIPEMGFDVPKTLARRLAFGLRDDVSIAQSDYQRRNAWVWQAQDQAVAECGAMILDPTRYLCSKGRCYGSMNLRPLYFDDDHLSESGNRVIKPIFAPVFGPP